MGQVTVRRLDDTVIARHKERARAKGISLEEELRQVLTRAAEFSRQELIEDFRRIRASAKAGNWPSGWELIREDRDNDEPYR